MACFLKVLLIPHCTRGWEGLMDLIQYLREKKAIVDEALERYLPDPGGVPPSLYKAMRYSLFAEGKRIRPILAIAAFEAVGGKGDRVLPFACALEMIHAYSLIHDDLPAIDNDDFRRGQLTSHKVFGEGVAILTGDALLTEAFRVMTDPRHVPEIERDATLILELVNEVARAAGLQGMVAGQVVDVESEGKTVDLPTVEYIHSRKTGAMIRVSVRVGARMGGARSEGLEALTRYGDYAGLAFQVMDDILNVEGDARILGKSTGSDEEKRKATYPSVLGVEESKQRARRLVDEAVRSLSSFGEEAEPLREIARFILSRGR